MDKSFKISGLLLSLSCIGGVAYGQYAVDVNGLPILNSNAGAMGSLFIDFDGGNWPNVGNLGAYDTDGNAATFSTSEQDDIYKAWRDVSTHFAMFDVNVTTVAPDKSVTPTAHVIVSNDMTGGAANANWFGEISPNARGAVGSSMARTRTTAITHELGHIMGLGHQSVYDENGVRTQAYRGVDEWNIAPIMGVDYAGKFSSWQTGLTAGGGPVPQHDLEVIAGAIVREYNEFSGNTYTGDGFRVDDHGNGISSATNLPKNFNNGPYETMISGVIERHADVDFFKIYWAGGDFNAFVEAERNLAANPEFASSLGMNLTLHTRYGSVVTADFATDPADTDAQLSVANLSRGYYNISVSSAGGYDDLGVYNLWIDNGVMAAAAFAAVPEPSSLALLGIGGLMIARRRRG